MLRKKKQLICATIVLTLLLCACSAQSASAAQSGSADSAASLPGISAQFATDQQDIQQDMKEYQTLQKAAEKALGDTVLALNEQYAFAYESGFLLAGGSGAEIAEASLLTEIYPSWKIPDEIDALLFSYARVLAGDNPSVRKVGALPADCALDTVRTLALRPENIEQAQLVYGEGDKAFSIMLYPESSAFLALLYEAQAVETLPEGKVVVQDITKEHRYVHWKADDTAYYWQIPAGKTPAQVYEIAASCAMPAIQSVA